MKISAAWRIFLGVVVVQIIAALVIVGWFFYSIRPDIDRLVVSNAQQTVLQSVEATEKYFAPVDIAIQAMQQLIAEEVLDRDRPEQLERYLHDKLRLWPQFAGLFIGYADGEFYYVMRDNAESSNGTRTKIISQTAGQRQVTLTWRDTDYAIVRTADDPEDTYDPRERPWYRLAAEKSEVVWTDPYIFFTSKKPGVTAAIAIGDDEGAPKAVVGIDMEIQQISRYLAKITFGPQRSAFVIGSEDEIISHSDIGTVLSDATDENDKPRFLKLQELEGIEPTVRSGIKARLSNQLDADVPAVWHDQSGDGDYIIAMATVSNASWPWKIVTVTDLVNKLGVASGGSDIILIVIMLFTIIAAIAIGYALARSIGRPLGVLWSNAKLARNGNIELMDEIASGYQEIDGTAEILNELGQMHRHKGTGPSTKG